MRHAHSRKESISGFLPAGARSYPATQKNAGKKTEGAALPHASWKNASWKTALLILTGNRTFPMKPCRETIPMSAVRRRWTGWKQRDGGHQTESGLCPKNARTAFLPLRRGVSGTQKQDIPKKGDPFSKGGTPANPPPAVSCAVAPNKSRLCAPACCLSNPNGHQVPLFLRSSPPPYRLVNTAILPLLVTSYPSTSAISRILI